MVVCSVFSLPLLFSLIVYVPFLQHIAACSALVSVFYVYFWATHI